MEQCCPLVTTYEYFLLLIDFFYIYFYIARDITAYCKPVIVSACTTQRKAVWCLHSVSCYRQSLTPAPIFTAQFNPLQEHRGFNSSMLLMLFKSINILHLSDRCRCCCQCVRKCWKARMTECPRPRLGLHEAGLMDALMLGADVSMRKCSQHSGVNGGAWLPLACAAAARVPAATVWLRVP